MRARYYDPSNGRFYGEDAVWGTDLFPYSDNNPIANIDPGGTTSTKEIWNKSWAQVFDRAKKAFTNPETYKTAFAFAMLMVDGGAVNSEEAAITSGGGRLGNASTRLQNYNLGTQLEEGGAKIIGGGGRYPEEYLKPLGGGRSGGSYVDITATKNGEVIRINTVDTYKSGRITSRELKNASRIEKQTGREIKLIPKKR